MLQTNCKSMGRDREWERDVIGNGTGSGMGTGTGGIGNENGSGIVTVCHCTTWILKQPPQLATKVCFQLCLKLLRSLLRHRLLDLIAAIHKICWPWFMHTGHNDGVIPMSWRHGMGRCAPGPWGN